MTAWGSREHLLFIKYNIHLKPSRARQQALQFNIGFAG
jgi:hypothetical protein